MLYSLIKYSVPISVLIYSIYKGLLKKLVRFK